MGRFIERLLSRPAPLLIALAFTTIAGHAHAKARFGTLCQSAYQNGWQHTLPEVWNRCAWFNDELNDTDTEVFYYNLHGAKPYIENSSDQYLSETVNLLYVNTHGGAWSDTAAYAMWNNGQDAFTKNMRLGDESTGLGMLSTYSCDTLKHDDKLITRWDDAMRGGLRYVSGSFDTVYDGVTTNEQGEVYADELQHQSTFKYAWRDSIDDFWTDEDPAVLATGTNSSNCSSRKNNMRWQNYTSYGRLRDSAIGYYCTTWWSL